MKKNVSKLGVLGLSLVAALAVAFVASNAQAQTTGQVSLTIDSGSSYCLYGTSIDLGSKSVAADFGALTFSGDFNAGTGNTWSCTDFAGTPAGWDLTIQTTELTNETNNTIDAGNVLISHSSPYSTAGSCSVGGTYAWNIPISSPHTIVAKAGSANRTVCTVVANNVALEVQVPANQAPGKYTGTLTITLPVFN